MGVIIPDPPRTVVQVAQTKCVRLDCINTIVPMDEEVLDHESLQWWYTGHCPMCGTKYQLIVDKEST